jgi:nitrate reductase gamma subunit
MVILGVVAALVGGAGRRRTRLPGLPGRDRIALVLIGSVVLAGFVLEGMRIAMTGFPEGAAWAFLGSAVANVFGRGGYLVNLYGYVWYIHAALAGAFIAYIPFSRLSHIIVGPLILAGNAAGEHRHGRA